MNAPIDPRIIAPGWIRRWTRQSLDLLRRDPVAVALTMGAIAALSALLANSLLQLLQPALAIAAGAWVYALARALDRPGDGPAAAPAAARQLRDASRDLMILAASVTMALIGFWLLVEATLDVFRGTMWLTVHVAAWANPRQPGIQAMKQALNAPPPPSKPAPALTPTETLLPWLWGGSMQSVLLFGTPIGLTMLYLVLRFGVSAGPTAIIRTSHRAADRNPWVSRFFFVAAMASVFAAIMVTFLDSLRWTMAGGLLNAAAFVVLTVWGYLWNREMFEGRRENVPVVAREAASQRALLPVAMAVMHRESARGGEPT